MGAQGGLSLQPTCRAEAYGARLRASCLLPEEQGPKQSLARQKIPWES